MNSYWSILYYRKQIKTSINLTIFENGFGHDSVGYYILIDTILKDNLEKVYYLIISIFNWLILFSFLTIVQKDYN